MVHEHADAMAKLDDPASMNKKTLAAIQELTQGITHVGKAVSELPLRSYAAPFYESKQFQLPAFTFGTAPVLLLPFHALRMRALIRTDGGKVQVGSMEQLTSQMGYSLVAGGGSEEFKTYERIFALNTDTANPSVISIWAEYAAR